MYSGERGKGCILAVGRVCSGVVYPDFRYNNKGQNDSYRCNRARLYSWLNIENSKSLSPPGPGFLAFVEFVIVDLRLL